MSSPCPTAVASDIATSAPRRTKAALGSRPALSLDVSFAAKHHLPVVQVSATAADDVSKTRQSADDKSGKTITQILDYVYVGSFDATRLDVLQARGITHILNVSQHCTSLHTAAMTPSPESLAAVHNSLASDSPQTPNSKGSKQQFAQYSGFTTHQIPIADHSDANIAAHFDEGIRFISSARECGGKVLVHCHQGVSRSPTIVIAYLVHAMDMSLANAMDFVQVRRKWVCPNLGFILALDEWAQNRLGEAKCDATGSAGSDKGESGSTAKKTSLMAC